MNKNDIQIEYDKISRRSKISNKVLGFSILASMISVPVFINSWFHGLNALGTGAALFVSTTAVLAASSYSSVILNTKKEELEKELEKYPNEEENKEKTEEEVEELIEDKTESNQIDNTYSNVVSINSTRKRILKPNKKKDND